MKKTILYDILIVIKLLKYQKIPCLDKRIPVAVLHLIYSFFWNIFYRAKVIANHRKNIRIESKDIKLACVFFSKKIIKKTNMIFKKEFFTKIHDFIIPKNTKKKAKNKIFGRKNYFQPKNQRIV